MHLDITVLYFKGTNKEIQLWSSLSQILKLSELGPLLGTHMISEEQVHWNWEVAPDVQWVNRNQGLEVEGSEIMFQKYFEFCLPW